MYHAPFQIQLAAATLQGHPDTLPVIPILAQVLRDTVERIQVNHKICSYSNFEYFHQLLALRAACWGSCQDPINILSSGKEGARALLSIPLLSAIIGWWEMFHPSPRTVEENQLFCVYRSGSRDRGVQKTTKKSRLQNSTHELNFIFFEENRISELRER